jgi:hypothetical protein
MSAGMEKEPPSTRKAMTATRRSALPARVYRMNFRAAWSLPASPQGNQQIGGDQDGFPEEIEKKEIQAEKTPIRADIENKKANMKLLYPAGDGKP